MLIVGGKSEGGGGGNEWEGQRHAISMRSVIESNAGDGDGVGNLWYCRCGGMAGGRSGGGYGHKYIL